MKKFSIMDADDKAKEEARARRKAPAVAAVTCEALNMTCVRVKLNIQPKKTA